VTADIGWVLTFEELRKTTDGGRTWRLYGSLTLQLGGYRIATVNVGKSTDGGATWADLVNLGAEDPTHCLPPGIDYWHFFDSSTAWGLDSQGDLRTTSDGGASWTRLDLNLGLTHMYFLDDAHAWAVSKDALFRISP